MNVWAWTCVTGSCSRPARTIVSPRDRRPECSVKRPASSRAPASERLRGASRRGIGGINIRGGLSASPANNAATSAAVRAPYVSRTSCGHEHINSNGATHYSASGRPQHPIRHLLAAGPGRSPRRSALQSPSRTTDAAHPPTPPRPTPPPSLPLRRFLYNLIY